jgi:hypothetical protein
MQPVSSSPAAVAAIANFSDFSFIGILDFQSTPVFEARDFIAPPRLHLQLPHYRRI